MKRLLLTGANGFTGKHLGEMAKINGFDVIPLVADLTDRERVFEEISTIEPTHVCHLAAISSVTHLDEEAFYKVNLFGTLNLLSALEGVASRIQKVLLTSSANIYGNAGSDVLHEGLSPKPNSHYAVSKLAMECMAQSFLRSLPILFVRPFNYTGVGHDDRFVIPKIVNHYARSMTQIELGNLDVEREYNDVRMVCDAYLRLLDSGKAGDTYNVCSGRSYNLKQVLFLMQEITGVQLEVVVNPALVRLNEVHKLTGSPDKLEYAIGDLKHCSLKDTLAWMLASKASQLPQ